MARTGLLLGAGASFELGMPLVSDLTAELRNWLTPDQFRALNLGWRMQEGGYPDPVVDDFVSVLIRPEMHYENVLGHIEVQFRRPSPHRQSYHGLYSWLVEIVHHLLYQRHIRNEIYISTGLRYFEGIAGLAQANSPLWVFSLNHDLLIECLAAQYGLTLECGFPDRQAVPRRDIEGRKIGDLALQRLPGDQFASSGLAFPNPGGAGIHLIKIHGGLDVFTANDGTDLVRLAPVGPGVGGILEALRSANEELLFAAPQLPGGRAKTINEITYADDDGIMQFMRRTLLSGAFKFDQRSSQVLPRAILDQFKAQLNHVSQLICIGYGGGDLHINSVLRHWLEHSAGRRIEFVGPGLSACPPFLGHLSMQVSLVDAIASDYLARYAFSPLSASELAMKQLRHAARLARQREVGFA